MSDPTSELDKLRAELATTKAQLAQARAVVSTSEVMISGLKGSGQNIFRPLRQSAPLLAPSPALGQGPEQFPDDVHIQSDWVG
jgi:outer membrane protein TolC